jgi:NAD(P) transhydrogenase
MLDDENIEGRSDVIVIGSGPGGEGAAMQAAKNGKSVTLIEQNPLVGGTCTHWGTIPSKALRFAARRMMEVIRQPLLREVMEPTRLSFPQLMQSAANVVQRQVDLRYRFYERNDVQMVLGKARFVDPHTVEVEKPHGARERHRGEAVVIATGSRPYRPPDVDFSQPRIFDSETVLRMTHTPRSMTVYGAGVVGCEYASIFRALDMKVNLVNTRQKLLEFLDDEIIDALSYHLRDQGVLIRHEEVYDGIRGEDDAVVLQLKSGKRLKTDALLWANGRIGNADGLDLEAIGVTADRRHYIRVNQHYQTEVPHIYAVGDVVGPPALASVAYDQGRIAMSHLLFGRSDHFVEMIPVGIYTAPEISSVGRTERELTEAAVPYEVGHAFFKSIARAQITGHTVGMLKLLFHRDTLQILGVHCFGDEAAEIIHIGQAILSQSGDANSLKYFVNTTFNYPTMAEAYRVAALNGLNRVL